jgi:hypothetical protein
MVRVVMFQAKKFLLPGDDRSLVENYTALEYLAIVAGKRVPVRVGLSVVGYVSDFRADGDKVVGQFQEVRDL